MEGVFERMVKMLKSELLSHKKKEGLNVKKKNLTRRCEWWLKDVYGAFMM